jgi:hypothetical protein
MTREQKIKKRIERANKRRKIRQDIYLTRKNTANHYGVPLSAVNKEGRCDGYWVDPSSPTGYSQKCDYDAWGTCQYPCNGDC